MYTEVLDKFELPIDAIQDQALPKEFLEKAYAEKWFKIFVSKKFNGLETTLPEGLAIIRLANQMMGSFGWCINLGSGANYFSGFYNLSGAEKVFLNKTCVLAGSGGLASRIEEVEGGYLVSGKWGKATGTAHATFFTCNGILPNGEKVSLTLNRKDITIHKDWNLFAMKLSSSYGFSAENAFVSYDMLFRINEPIEDTSYAIHQLKFESFAAFCMCSAAIGLAEGIVEKIKNEELKPNVKLALSELEKCIQEKQNGLEILALDAWNLLNENPTQNPSEEILSYVKITGKQLFIGVNELYYSAGLVMADESKNVHHQYKDFMLAIQHSIFK